jgi:hypothetical protein
MFRIVGSFFLILVSASYAAQARSQAATETGKGNDLYATALIASITEMEKQWGNLDDSNGDRIRTDYKHMIVEENPDLTDGLPTEFGPNRVDYLSDRALIGRYKAQKKKFLILVIHPIKTDGSLLTIGISMHWVSYRKGRLLFEIEGGSEVTSALNCGSETYKVSSVKLSGI